MRLRVCSVFLIVLFCLPSVLGFWSYFSFPPPPPPIFRLSDINGEDINVHNVTVLGDFNAITGYFDTLFTRVQVNQIEIDLNVVNDGNFQGSLGIFGQSFFSNFVNLHADPVLPLHAATKEYVDIAVSGIEFDFFLTDSASDIATYFDLVDFDTGEVVSTNTSVALNAGLDQEIFNYATVVGQPEFEVLLSSVYDGHFHLQKTGGASKTVEVYWTLYERDSGGTEFLIITSENSEEVTIVQQPFDIHAVLGDDEQIDGNRLVLKIFADVVGGGATAQVVLAQEGTTDSHVSLRPPNTALSQLFLERGGNNWMNADLNLGGFTLQNGDVNATGDSNFVNVGISENLYSDKNAFIGEHLQVGMDLNVTSHFSIDYNGTDVIFSFG